jgi:hypothetical protein
MEDQRSFASGLQPSGGVNQRLILAGPRPARRRGRSDARS